MRRESFDIAISLYNVDHGMGYSNIDCLAWVSGAATIRGYNASGTFAEFDGWGVLRKYLLEKTSFIWLIINGLTTIILFIFITLGLLCEWTIRKMFLDNAIEKNPEIERQQIIIPKTPARLETSRALPPGVHQKI